MEKVKDNIRIEKYPEYKDSGVEWLGEIPSHWEIIKLRNIGVFSASGIDKYLKVNESKVKIINFTDIYANKSMTLDSSFDYMVVTTPESNRIKHLVKKGDLIFLPSSETYEDLGAAALVNEELENTSFSYHVIRLVFQKEIDHSFRKYLTNNTSVLNQFSRQGKGSTREIIGRGVFKDVQVIIPPLPEQTAIAAFLDRKTALIDQAIDIKQKQIELLKERRQILIHKAVTRGLNPNVKLKNSGVEWIGEIPEGWEVKRLKYILNGKLKYGANESGMEYDISLPRYVRITDFGQDGKLSEDSKLSLSWKQGGDYLLKDGDILFARSGATVGKTYQFKKLMSIEDNYCYAGYLIKAEANEDEILSDFLYLYTNSSLFNKWKDSIFIKATIENIGADKYSVLPVVVPSIGEQIQILEKYKSDNEKISTAISLKEQEIEKLKEYKTTLINSAVTGKIKVC